MATDDLDSLSVNRILAALPLHELEHLASVGDARNLGKGDIVQRIGDPIDSVLFPLGCLISMQVELADGTSIEVATIGRDGFAGLPVFFGAHTTTLRGEVKLAGQALLLEGDEFRRQIESNSRLCSLLGRYTELLFLEAAQLTACNRTHSIEQRCARWLLSTADQLGGDSVPTSQAGVAQALGVRRASVTIALTDLEHRDILSLQRGRIAILDRAKLLSSSCECYAALSEEYHRASW